MLNETIENYERAINNDVQSIINIFRKQYCAMVKEFSVYENNNCTDCGIAIKTTFSRNKRSNTRIKDIIWLGQV